MICKYLTKFINEYNDVYEEVWGRQNFKHPLGEYIRKDIAEKFRELSFLKTEHHVVKASCGTGKWTAVPWIAIFDKRITQSAQKGVYIVYLLNKESKELYLTLNQAASGSTLIELENNAKRIQEQLGVSHFEKIKTGSDAYDAGCICSKLYTTSGLNDSAKFADDLAEFVELYEKYYAIYSKDNGKSLPPYKKTNSESIKGKFCSWFAEQPQRNNPLAKYKDDTIDAAIRLLERGMSKLGLSKYVDLNCFTVTDYSEFKIIHDECYAYAEKFDKGQNHSDFRNGLDYYLLFLKELANSTIADKVKQIIQAYKDDFETRDKEERYKWVAVGTYKKIWDIDSNNFADMLKSAFNDTANLLRSGNYYPYKMLCIFAEKEPETVRSLFKMLYDESISFEERCSKFKDAFDAYFKPQGLNNYQDLHAISVYLTCEYPEKYYIYKYSIVKEFIKQVQYECDSIDKMTDSEKMELMFELYDIVLRVVKDDSELQEMSKSRLDDTCHQDEAFHILAHDIIYFASKYELESKIGIFDSWEIIDEVTAIKTCDKSFFDYNGSGVPKSICWFFEAEYLETSENKSLSLIHNGVTYDAKVQNDSTDRRRVRIFWNAELGKVFNSYKDSDVKAKFVKVSELVYEITIIGGEKEMTVKEKINAIKEYIAAKGFNYEGDLIENFYLSLKSKPFVILAGTSGTGKTRLVKLFAEAIGAKMKLVPVRPDWSDSSDLFGHTDLSGNFQPGAIIDFIKQAEWNNDTPYFLCLDEMNLARVEYYLSDFLSVIETRDRKVNGEIETDPLIDVDYYKDDDAKVKYGRVFIPENLYIVGTVNMDETTFPFSKKVLDRANTIEFSYVNLMSKVGGEKEAVAQKLDNSFLKTDYLYLRDCDDTELVDNICFDLEELNQILVKANLHVGYRVRDEISFYLMNNQKADLLPKEAAFDNEIMQKILPRIQGSSAAIKDVLSELFIKCAGDYTGFNGSNTYEQMESYIESKECKYPNSAKKIRFMMRRYEEDGFTSYWL